MFIWFSLITALFAVFLDERRQIKPNNYVVTLSRRLQQCLLVQEMKVKSERKLIRNTTDDDVFLCVVLIQENRVKFT